MHRIPSSRPGGLTGLRLVSFESRRAHDMALLLRRHGGDVLYAPSMREIPLADERGILEFGARLFNGACDALILLTGVGTTILVDALCTRYARAALIERLGRTLLLCRGPKAAGVLQRLGLTPTLVAPDPHTEKELLRAVDHGFAVADKRVFVQEYGAVSDTLLAGLRARGAVVKAVKVYRWALPEDTRDLRSALQSIAHGSVDAAIFTSAHQVENVFEYAGRVMLADGLRNAFRRSVLVASIGPVTSDALARHGVTADVAPEHAKMASLVSSLATTGGQLLRRKRGPRP